MFVAVTDAALHDVSTAILGVLLASVAFTGGVGPMSLSFALKETLDVVLCVEESTSGEIATFAFALALAFALTAEALLEEATKSSDWLSIEASPGSPGHPVLEEQGF